MCAVLGAIHPAQAGLQIDITKGGQQAIPIALPVIINLGADGTPQAADQKSRAITQVIADDLGHSGLFQLKDPGGFLQDSTSLWRMGPRYRDWRLIGSEVLIYGAIKKENKQLAVNFFIHDVFQGNMLGKGKRFTAPLEDWRHVAHRVADEIYTRVTGEKPYFTSRIAFIAQKGQNKWLALMDQDGANRIDLTKGKSLVLTPRFSPDGKRLFYLSYETGMPRIFRWDLYTGKRYQQGNYKGLNSAPSWSPDGRKMAMTLTKDGNSEIYIRDLKNKRLTRLTKHRGIDTSPSWSPKGSRIVFNSNRAGSPQLYVMDSDGGNPQRITFDGRYNAAPSWSPRGDKIAFVKGGSGHFRIATTDPEGRHTKVLTNSWMDESPTWSPNGRVILFSRQNGNHTRLYTIDLTGHNERLVPLEKGLDGSDPSWSPLIR
ncbi:MAG: Tol-Pal system protein TolB [Magnetococcales bacterium]|nr:Tol-Pal system protein TolB [Magnetococcales bacterium]